MQTNMQICGDGLVPSTLVKSLDRFSLSILIIVNYMILQIWFWKSDTFFGGWGVGGCVPFKCLAVTSIGLNLAQWAPLELENSSLNGNTLPSCIEVDAIPGPPTKIILLGLDNTQVNRCNAYMLLTLGYDYTCVIFDP